MCPSNFRIKLNLCKYYNDVRRFCWIFIDGRKILQISHMKQRITKLFNIKEPFHLLLNETDYLPPNEDIRILKENEMIVVSPGSGLKNELDLSVSIVTLSEDRNRQEAENSSIKSEKIGNSVQHKQLQTNLSFMLSSLVQEAVSSDATNKSENDLLEVSVQSCENENSEESSIAESKTVETNLANDLNATENIASRSKRKRVRRNKKKTKQVEQSATKEEENKLKKPKIINSCIVAPGKHIRFDSLNNEEVIEEEAMRLETINGNDTTKTSASDKLANLLSLGNNSVPLTFTNTKIKDEVKVEHTSDEETQFDAYSENTNESVAISKKFENLNGLLNKDFETYPIMNVKPQFKDVIAFKMLKIGADYTPQISNFILAEVVSCCPRSSMYTFKVSQGLPEVQVPVGKFTLVEEEEERVMNDTITLNYAQIMQPRLISRCDPDRAVTPVNCIN